jgi:hypothetical protein
MLRINKKTKSKIQGKLRKMALMIVVKKNRSNCQSLGLNLP